MAQRRAGRREIARFGLVRSEALQNAKSLLRSAEQLARSRRYGYASAFAVLAFEETAKSLMYHLAANRLIRFVKGKGNGITTYSERDLTLHEFKQGVIVSVLNLSFRYAPLFALMQNPPKTSTREEFARHLGTAILAQQRYEIEMARPNSRLQAEVRSLFRILGELNARKNKGLYVDVNGAEVSLPRQTSKKSFEEVYSIAAELATEVDTVMSQGYSEMDRALLAEHRRWVASRVRQSRGNTNKAP